MPITKGSLWFATGCACILCLSTGLGFSLVRHRAAELQITALNQQMSDAKIALFALRSDVGRDLDFLRSQQKRTNQIIEELVKVTQIERTDLEQSISKVEARLEKAARESQSKENAAILAELKYAIAAIRDDMKSESAYQLECRNDDRRNTYKELTILRGEIMSELRLHILQGHR
ncbi:MAG: hypothetical protein WC378_15795 [Opitutaceae bacterium]|jgi:TolA-binding protein